jgi:hypothetical protein
MTIPKRQIEIGGSKSRRPGTAAVRLLRWSVLNSHLLLLAALLLLPPALRAQPLTMHLWSITAGGGTSTGGSLKLSGSVGQTSTGGLTGGNFSLQGGFWSVLSAVQTQGGPLLSILVTNGAVIISWPKPATGWSLQTTPALSGPGLNWTPVTQTYQDNGSSLSVTLSAPHGNAFFRLHNP